MRNIPLFIIMLLVLILPFCNTAKRATTQQVRLVYYDTDIQQLIEAKCTPCHIPSKGGRKESLDNYESVKKHIDEMIRRVELNPGDNGFMPFKHPKLRDSAISVFRNWRTQGMRKSKL